MWALILCTVDIGVRTNNPIKTYNLLLGDKAKWSDFKSDEEDNLWQYDGSLKVAKPSIRQPN